MTIFYCSRCARLVHVRRPFEPARIGAALLAPLCPECAPPPPESPAPMPRRRRRMSRR